MIKQKCEYGCETEGKYFFKRVKKWCCSDNANRCPAKRLVHSKNAKGNTHGTTNKGRTFALRECPHCDSSIPLNNYKKHINWCNGAGKIAQCMNASNVIHSLHLMDNQRFVVGYVMIRGLEQMINVKYIQHV